MTCSASMYCADSLLTEYIYRLNEKGFTVTGTKVYYTEQQKKIYHVFYRTRINISFS